MSGLPWIQFYPSDWLAGTRGMTASETGIYITLIATMYERGEPLIEDAGRLARLCGASPSAFKNAVGVLVSEGKIERFEGGLWNNRVGRELAKRLEKSEVAKQSANSRWTRSDEISQQNQRQENANALPTESERNANQKPEARSQNKKEIVCRKRSSYTESFDKFWTIWRDLDRKRGGPLWQTHAKEAAARQWVGLTEDQRESAQSAAAAYQAECKAKSHDPKHAERYLRDRVFENYDIAAAVKVFTVRRGSPEWDAWCAAKTATGSRFIPDNLTVPTLMPTVNERKSA